MKFTTTLEALLRPLQLVTGVVERRQTLPVLSNLLVRADENGLSLTGTDLEVELVATLSFDRGAGREHHDSGAKARRYLAFAARGRERFCADSG